MNKKKWIITAIILAVFCAALGIYNYYGKRSPAEESAGEPIAPRSRNTLNVNGLIIRPQSLTDGITTVGNLLPDEEVDLSFETSGKIVAINFQEGAAVRKGQLLAKVNDRPLQAQLSRYEAQLKLAEDRVYRQSALLERDAVSQEAYEQARTELATLNADIDIVKSNIALTELCAPFDGIIGLRNVSEGAYASPSVVVAKLTKISPLKIDFYVPERYASQIHPGTRLSFTVEGRQERFEATVYATETQVDVTTRTLAVRARYPNARGRLLPGRFATVEIRMHEISDAIAVPTEAIVPEMGIDKVFLYRGGKAHAVEVTTGLRTESQIQIINGLQVGDTLLTSGTLQLREGLPVQLDRID
ncbi:efflux transporter periplasmic adaptor subunit [Alistipes sp. An116]|uniref:efflux RND transporter periplasmic adaptor subunit n=1 Tax=Alistipes sp. An116 TaxID=1965546 RepID=UPI000B393593|nr:efflux RND transporter periplasmic adaptor subunit [Alistipes sp. An116]OUQ54265.1 efflux transporter periplasmic adaptor subunit [Alistipes sp. An116]